jgi:D-alanyl-D-alanine carboxypeptidase
MHGKRARCIRTRRAFLPLGVGAFLGVVLMLPAVTVAGSWSQAVVSTSQAAPALVKAVQAALDSLRVELGFPGATAAIWLPDGSVTGFATGLADSGTGAPMTPEHRMPAGSVGKSFVAAVALTLVQEGRLELGATIDRWLGDEPWFGRLRNGRAITLRMLLTHSSGLPDHVKEPAFMRSVGNLVRPGADPDAVITPRQVLEYVLDRDPLFPPGEGMSYTDTGYILVGLIIEKATGRTYYEELRRRFLEPFGLKRTVPADRRDLPGLACGNLKPDNPFGLPIRTLAADGYLNHNPALEWTGGGLVANPQDLVRWAASLYGGRALPGPYLDDLLDTVPWDPDGPGYDSYGLGVIVDATPLGITYGHSGWYPGYHTVLAYYPADRFAVAVQVNRDYDSGAKQVAQRLAAVVQSRLAAAE